MWKKSNKPSRPTLAPLIEADGGSIEVLSFDDDTLSVKLGGSYGGCPGVPEVCAGVIEPVASRRSAGR